MTPDEFGVFSARLIAVQELLDGPALSESRLVLYFEALSDLALEDVLRALGTAMRTSTFLPKPAELRTLAVGDTADGVEASWLLFRKAMREAGAYASLATVDPALGATIEAMFDGWPQACSAEFSPEMWTAKRKEFERIYRVVAQRGLVGPRYLPGLIEQQNGGRAEWRTYTTIAVIGATGIERLEGVRAEQYRAALPANPPEGRPAGFIDIGTIAAGSGLVTGALKKEDAS
jgi:hypothetical protein